MIQPIERGLPPEDIRLGGVNGGTFVRRAEYICQESACSSCGKCMEVCPMRLEPLKMYRAERSGNVEEMKYQNIMDCIECGCCAYTCPATIPLVQSFRAGKQRIRDAAAKK